MSVAIPTEQVGKSNERTMTHHHVVVQMGSSSRRQFKCFIATSSYVHPRPRSLDKRVRIFHVYLCARKRSAWRAEIYTLTSDNSIRTRDRRNDILHHSLSQAPSDSFDLEFVGSSDCFLKEPFDMFWIVIVELLVCAVRQG